MIIAGIDLAGPSNHCDTACAILRDDGLITLFDSLNDTDLFELIQKHEVTHVGIDAPLSYSESGGYRQSDSALRRLLNEKGFPKIGVMAPTYSRMIYLTARGIRLTRLFSYLDSNPEIYEAHPGAFLALEGFPYDTITSVKENNSAIGILAEKIVSQGYRFESTPKTDHQLMAAGVALTVHAKLNEIHHWEMSDSPVDGFLFIA